MCNSNNSEYYIDIEIVRLLNMLYQDKDKVSNEQLKTFVAPMQANIAIEWKGTNLESLKGNLSHSVKVSKFMNISTRILHFFHYEPSWTCNIGIIPVNLKAIMGNNKKQV